MNLEVGNFSKNIKEGFHRVKTTLRAVLLSALVLSNVVTSNPTYAETETPSTPVPASILSTNQIDTNANVNIDSINYEQVLPVGTTKQSKEDILRIANVSDTSAIPSDPDFLDWLSPLANNGWLTEYNKTISGEVKPPYAYGITSTYPITVLLPDFGVNAAACDPTVAKKADWQNNAKVICLDNGWSLSDPYIYNFQHLENIASLMASVQNTQTVPGLNNTHLAAEGNVTYILLNAAAIRSEEPGVYVIPNGRIEDVINEFQVNLVSTSITRIIATHVGTPKAENDFWRAYKQRGGVHFVAAGNDGQKTPHTLSESACTFGAIVVGSQKNGVNSDFTSYTPRNKNPDLVRPGEDPQCRLTTYGPGQDLLFDNTENNYFIASGTSFATPATVAAAIHISQKCNWPIDIATEWMLKHQKHLDLPSKITSVSAPGIGLSRFDVNCYDTFLPLLTR